MNSDKIICKAEEILRDKEYIVAAYLFGSVATGKDHEDSDIDIGIVVEGTHDFSKTTELEKELSRKMERKADLRVLNTQETQFKYHVLKTGELILSKDEKKRTEFEEHVMRKYLDMKPFYETYNKYVKERLTA